MDYWYHGYPGSDCGAPELYPTDLSNSTGSSVRPADAPGVNGTYDAVIFTAEAVRLIREAGTSQKGMYMYLAYQNGAHAVVSLLFVCLPARLLTCLSPDFRPPPSLPRRSARRLPKTEL
eukprot:COSAG01_NODE_6114_length_3843_cov_2.175481_3_plen_119_part_00